MGVDVRPHRQPRKPPHLFFFDPWLSIFRPTLLTPIPPSNGDTYVDAASGTEWEYNATNNSWTIVSSSAPGGGAFVYIGEHDFTQATVPSPVAEAGFVYSQSDIGNAPGNVNGVYTGIAGDTIVEGTLVLYTGSSWTFLSTTPGYPNLGDGNGDTLDTRYVRTQGRRQSTSKPSLVTLD